MRLNRETFCALYDLARIPGPSGGSASASLDGLVAHSKDAVMALGFIREILADVCEGHADEAIGRAERWYLWRKSQDWDTKHAGQQPTPPEHGAGE